MSWSWCKYINTCTFAFAQKSTLLEQEPIKFALLIFAHSPSSGRKKNDTLKNFPLGRATDKRGRRLWSLHYIRVDPTTNLNSVDLITYGWQGIALPLIKTGEYRWYLFSLEQKKIIEHDVISSGLEMAIKVFPLSDKIPNVTRNHIRTEFTCKQVKDWAYRLATICIKYIKWGLNESFEVIVVLIWQQTYLQSTVNTRAGEKYHTHISTLNKSACSDNFIVLIKCSQLPLSTLYFQQAFRKRLKLRSNSMKMNGLAVLMWALPPPSSSPQSCQERKINSSQLFVNSP